jgi:2-polyprenyl-3-methyl-5-hydroxy-6-metoxy-1,4-benzoquinol methylase
MDLDDVRKVRNMVRERLETVVRRAWMKYALRGVKQNDAHDRLERAYLMPDPWKLDSAPERARFTETNVRIERAFGHVGSLLEIGCGEGHQSEHLVTTCDKLTGIDVSATAVGRARKRLPQAEFAAGDLFAQPWSGEVGRFDVVVACEVLYYLSDVPRTLDAMTRLARVGCLVTYFAPAERKMGPHFAKRTGLERDSFRFGDTEWTAVWWRP